eukprot:CAMPEP_0202698874 /NCGR_PEP_ID=MMETSP1385-20130828/12119_1 /ASSEMBLY_ACC=CAM_ASM_000861 /TAXON_ID=933848 /ORGANISM="Elphidium margaritaceum" /LENGTH=314 /DNA_ID=CAMNT_0049355691 /DNA_START=42 /DNA_END=983 /DNA_ORIENTATION=-
MTANTAIVQNFVNDANTLTELYPLLQHIPLENIKHFIQSETEQLSPATVKSMQYNALPIEIILPPQLVQYCLSFNSFHGKRHARLVSKAWCEYCQRNEAMYYKNVYEAIISECEHNQHIRFNADMNRTIVVHRNLQRLLPIESKLGFTGPMYLTQALEVCKSGDRIILHKSKEDYPGPIPHNAFDNKEHIQLIGVGGRFVKLGMWPGSKRKSMYFENLEFSKGTIYCFTGIEDTVVFKNCRFPANDIKIGGAIDVVIDGCLFEFECNTTPKPWTAIRINTNARTVRIINSRFVNCVLRTGDFKPSGVIQIQESL